MKTSGRSTPPVARCVQRVRESAPLVGPNVVVAGVTDAPIGEVTALVTPNVVVAGAEHANIGEVTPLASLT